MTENRRNFSRVDFQAQTTLLIKGRKIDSKLVDLSLQGALVETEMALPLENGDVCDIEFTLNNGTIVLNIKAKLVYGNNANYGFKFSEIDLDTLTHLRRLIELNLGDSDQIRKELFFLVSTTNDT